MNPTRLTWLLLFCCVLSPSAMAEVRGAVAVIFLDENTLCVANSRSGSVALVDIATGNMRSEFTIAERLADLAAVGDGKHLLAVDDRRHELLLISRGDDKTLIRSRQPTSRYPASIAVSPNGQLASIAGLWSHQLQIVELADMHRSLSVRHTLDLPFPPREQLFLPDGKTVVVADAFGGRLAIVDAIQGNLLAMYELVGHNIGGMVLTADGKKLLISHQILGSNVPTTLDNITSGRLMRSIIRQIPLSALLDDEADLDAVSELHELGTPGNGAADPASMVLFSDGRIAVALAGTSEVALLDAGFRAARRIAVGLRPTEIVASPDRRHLVVVNSLGDSLSILNPQTGNVERTISLGHASELSPGQRGERLFYDARLSPGHWLSCHSCHPNGHTSSLLADTQGDGSNGAPKRILTLLGTRLTDKWAWNGSLADLHTQVQKSLQSTMRSENVTANDVGDLVAFLHTLPPPPPLMPPTEDAVDQQSLNRGRAFFQEHGCAACHVPPLTYTSPDVYDVDLSDQLGQRKFNPPSLRGVSQNAALFHDGRATSLESVFTDEGHQLRRDLSAEELRDLLRFLRSL